MNKKEYQKKWHDEHREEIAECGKRYYQKHKEEIAKQHKEYQQEHRNEMSVYKKLYRETHRNEISIHQKQWREQNKKKHNQQVKAWRNNHKKQWREIGKKSKFKRRKLGFIPLNEPFEGSEAHHICLTFVIYIPREMHKSIYHNIWTNKNMDKINTLAFDYLLETKVSCGRKAGKNEKKYSKRSRKIYEITLHEKTH